MKKILFYLLMAVSLQMSAQSTTYFGKPVELGKVPASESKADSVLVLGTDRIMKFVPRSEFEGGEIPTLQQVVTKDNKLTEDSFIFIGDDFGNDEFSGSYITSDGIFTSKREILEDNTNLDAFGGIGWNIIHTPDNYHSIESVFNLSNKDNSGKLSESRIFSHKGTAKTDFYLPDNNDTINNEIVLVSSVNGIKADANGNINVSGGGTQDLQQTLDNGETSNKNGGTAIILGLNKGGEPLTNIFYNDEVTGDEIADFAITNESGNGRIYLYAAGGNGTPENPYGYSRMTLGRDFGISSERKSLLFEKTLSPGDPENRIFIPEKTTIGTDYYLATRDEINLQTALQGGNQAINKSLTLLSTDEFGDFTLEASGNFISMTRTSFPENSLEISTDGLVSRSPDDEERSLVTGALVKHSGEDSEGHPIETSLSKDGIRFYSKFGSTLLKRERVHGESTDLEIVVPAKNGTIALQDDLKLKSYTVSTLPVGSIGDRAYVTDATAPTYLGAITGGGSVVCPVFYNGTAWVSH